MPENMSAALLRKGAITLPLARSQSALGVSADAAKLALNRLEKKSFIASPARGFYVTRPAGISLARLSSRRPVYPGADEAPRPPLLRGPAVGRRVSRRGASAGAGIPGVSSQRTGGRVAVRHGTVSRCYGAEAPRRSVAVESLDTPRGTVLVSSPEATALDRRRLRAVARAVSIRWRRSSELVASGSMRRNLRPPPGRRPCRLGAAARIPAGAYLGSDAGRRRRSEAYVRERAECGATGRAFAESAAARAPRRNKGWKLHVNASVEALRRVLLRGRDGVPECGEASDEGGFCGGREGRRDWLNPLRACWRRSRRSQRREKKLNRRPECRAGEDGLSGGVNKKRCAHGRGGGKETWPSARLREGSPPPKGGAGVVMDGLGERVLQL